MKARRILVVFAALAGPFGCGSDENDPITPVGASSSGATCSPASTLTYEGFAQPFFEDFCIRCHSSTLSGTARNGAPPGYNWDVYETIADHAGDIDSVAAAGPRATNDFMPPEDPRPTAAERARLGEWLACEFSTDTN